MAKRAMGYPTHFKLLPIILLQRKIGKRSGSKTGKICIFVDCIGVE
jgi:hypothetical protein